MVGKWETLLRMHFTLDRSSFFKLHFVYGYSSSQVNRVFHICIVFNVTDKFLLGIFD